VPKENNPMPDNWRVLDPRRSGRITRYHTWPRIQQQSVGEHSWQVMRIILAIWPDADRDLLIHTVTHDVGEIATGDLPFPAKARDPELKKKIDDAEKSTHLRMSMPWSLPAPKALSPEQMTVFKLAEYIEMWEWALDDMDMGNSNAELVRIRTLEAIEKMTPDVPTDVQVRAHSYMQRRACVSGPDKKAMVTLVKGEVVNG